ncbi:two-component system response regulator [Candidatus Auribacterota bacterium]
MTNILIIEDDKSMRKIYEAYFRGSDKYKIEILEDARLGYKRAKEGDFDLVLLDMIMEPMSGGEFYACFEDDPAMKKAPVIVVSVIDPVDLEHMKKYGEVSFIKKPVTKEQLFEKIDDVLSGKL